MGVSRGNMSQKSISSFFARSVQKKPEEKKIKDDTEENPAKTKACQDNSSSTLSAKHSGGIGTNSDEESKENSKVLANKSDTEEQTLSKDGTPPLRKTARNPAFKRKSESTCDSNKRKKEDDNQNEESKITTENKKDGINETSKASKEEKSKAIKEEKSKAIKEEKSKAIK